MRTLQILRARRCDPGPVFDSAGFSRNGISQTGDHARAFADQRWAAPAPSNPGS